MSPGSRWEFIPLPLYWNFSSGTTPQGQPQTQADHCLAWWVLYFLDCAPQNLPCSFLTMVLLHPATAWPAEGDELGFCLHRGPCGELGQLPGCTWEEALAGWLPSVCAATPSVAWSEQPRCVELSAPTWDSSWRFSLAELCGLPEEAELRLGSI